MGLKLVTGNPTPGFTRIIQTMVLYNTNTVAVTRNPTPGKTMVHADYSNVLYNTNTVAVEGNSPPGFPRFMLTMVLPPPPDLIEFKRTMHIYLQRQKQKDEYYCS